METKKIKYSTPTVISVELDHSISLQLESNPPFGPGEISQTDAPEFLQSNPFKNELA